MEINEFEERLRAINWSELSHAYGDAGDVPDAMMALLDPRRKVREDALRHLRHSINHQGFPEDSTVVALPFFFDLLQVPGVQDRDKLLLFIAELSHGYRQTKLGHTEHMRVYDWSPGPVLERLYQELYEKLCERLPEVVSSLADPDGRVKIATTYLLSWHPSASAVLLEHLRATRREEASPGLRLTRSIALGLCSLFARDYALESDREHLIGELSSSSLLGRFGAAVGLCYSGGAIGVGVLSVLREALIDVPYERALPWENGHLGSYAGVILMFLQEERGVDVAPIYQQVLEEEIKHLSPRVKHRREAGMQLGDIASELLTIAFKQRPVGSKWPEGYTPLQRWVLRFLARHPNIDISEGYSPLTNRLNEIALGHPTERRKKLRFGSLADLTQITREPPGRFFEVLDEQLTLNVKGAKRSSILALWERAWRADKRAQRLLLKALVDDLSCSQLCSLIEELLAQPSNTHELTESVRGALGVLYDGFLQRSGAAEAIVSSSRRLVAEGCLRYPMPSRTVFGAFAHLLLNAAPAAFALAASLLKGSVEFFEHQDTEVLRPILLQMPERERGEVIDALHIRSFAEPDEAWSLYDIAPSERRVKLLPKALREYADFFAGPGAFRLVQVLAAQPVALLGGLREELMRPRAMRGGYAHLIAAGFAQHEAREQLLVGVGPHKDARVSWIIARGRRLLARELKFLWIEEGNREYTRAKGGVIGANGKPWDGSMPRYRRK